MTFNTDGITHIGEVTSRTLREAIVEDDYTQSRIAGAVQMLTEVGEFVQGRIDAAGPYDDVRALRDLKVWLGDRIREVQSNATNGTD